jgi:hypothetical protein
MHIARLPRKSTESQDFVPQFGADYFVLWSRFDNRGVGGREVEKGGLDITRDSWPGKVRIRRVSIVCLLPLQQPKGLQNW